MSDPGRMPPLGDLDWPRQHRIIPSIYPPIDFFESLVDPEEMEILWYLEGMTNDRLRDQTGDITLVAPEDRVSGPGSSVVMAAFTHLGNPSRFSNGSYGVYYATRKLETAIRETVFHRERFLAFTNEPPCDINMRVYIGQVLKPLHNIRGNHYDDFHHPDIGTYPATQAFAQTVRATGSWGLVYRSVRHASGECIAIFRPPTVTIPLQGPRLAYAWDGRKIRAVYEKSEPLLTL